jgi:hypothetical protein
MSGTATLGLMFHEAPCIDITMYEIFHAQHHLKQPRNKSVTQKSKNGTHKKRPS